MTQAGNELKNHDDYLRQFAINIRLPPYNAGGSYPIYWSKAKTDPTSKPYKIEIDDSGNISSKAIWFVHHPGL